MRKAQQTVISLMVDWKGGTSRLFYKIQWCTTESTIVVNSRGEIKFGPPMLQSEHTQDILLPKTWREPERPQKRQFRMTPVAKICACPWKIEGSLPHTHLLRNLRRRGTVLHRWEGRWSGPFSPVRETFPEETHRQCSSHQHSYRFTFTRSKRATGMNRNR